MHHDVTAFIALLLVASLVAVAVQRLRIPYTVALVLLGMGLGPLRVLSGITISPDLVLTIFLPGLLFEAAQHIHLPDFLRDARVIVTHAVPGVVLSIGLTGVGVFYGLRWLGVDVAGQPVVAACLVGAMVAATDPISVIALFRTLKVDKRLGLLLEGESLFNDGTAFVLFGILLHVAGGGEWSLASGLSRFTLVVLGGAGLGLIAGLIVERLLRTTTDHVVEIALTVVLAYGVFLLAEELHVSGVIAVVVAGMVNGNLGARDGINSFSRIALFSFWEFAAFVINSMVFLIMGLSVPIADLWATRGPIAVTAGAMLLARAVGIYALTPLATAFGRPVPRPWRHVLYWGGLRGALSIVMALSLPADFPQRELFVRIIFGVVVLSVFGQGLTVGPLVRWLGLAAQDDGDLRLLRVHLQAHRAAVERLKQLLANQEVSPRIHDALRAEQEAAIAHLQTRLEAQQTNAAAVAAEEQAADTAVRETMRLTILEAYHHQELSADAANSLLETLDADAEGAH